MLPSSPSSAPRCAAGLPTRSAAARISSPCSSSRTDARRPLSFHQPVRELAVAAHVGEALVAALKQKRQLPVVQAEQLQDRRVQVVDVDAVLDRPEAELVGGPKYPTPLDPAARQP